jgi:hypothetical protein
MRLITRFCVGLALLASMPLAAAAASHAVDVTAVVLPAPTSQRAESPEMGRSAAPSDPIAAAPAATLQAPSNDNCAGAITIPCGNINLSGDTFLATNDYDFSDTTLSCTHYSAPGHDVVYKLNAQVGDQIWVDYQSLADASIYLVKDCSDVTHTCVAGADDGKQNEVEHLSYTFTTAGIYYLILDSYATNSYGTWTMVGQFLSCGLMPPPNDRCPTGTPLSCGTNSYSGTTENAANDYFFPSLGASCANSLAGGRDVAFKINATAGDSINVQYTSSANAVAYILGDSLG